MWLRKTWLVMTAVLTLPAALHALAPCTKDADCTYDGCSHSTTGVIRSNHSVVCRYQPGNYGSAGNNFCVNDANGGVNFCVEPLCPAGSFSSDASGRGNL